MIDIKCGNCNSEFPINKEVYMNRLGTNQRISCPSCLESMPSELIYVLNDLLRDQSLGRHKGWEIGLRFSKSTTGDA